jgi:acyl-ACP thioesterase
MIERIQKVHFTPFDRDPKGRIKWGTLSEKLQEAAWKHAESLNVGMKLLKEHGLFWAVTRQWIHFDEFHFPEEVFIHTWPRGFRGNFAFREFEIKDESGRVLLRSTTSWVLVSIHTRAVGPSSAVPDAFLQLNQPHCLEEDIPKIEFTGEGFDTEQIKARYYDLDINGHVNNTRYLTWLGNCFHDIAPDDDARDIILNFNGEINANEKVEMVYRNMDQFLFGLRKGDRMVFRAEVST